MLRVIVIMLMLCLSVKSFNCEKFNKKNSLNLLEFNQGPMRTKIINVFLTITFNNDPFRKNSTENFAKSVKQCLHSHP